MGVQVANYMRRLRRGGRLARPTARQPRSDRLLRGTVKILVRQ